MDITFEKLLSSGIIAVISLLIGYLPLLLTTKYDLSTIDVSRPLVMKKEKKEFKNIILSFFMNLGGGVLLSNCFLHWLPEVREGMEDIDTMFPLAEIILLCGFFFISGLEEILHHFLHPHKQKEYESIPSSDDQNNETTNVNIKMNGSKLKSALRTAFTVFSLSFHSIVEGITLGIEEDSAGVWLNAGATSLHKFVMAFAIGIELIANKVSKTVYNIYTIIFGIAGMMGSIIGDCVNEVAKRDEIRFKYLGILLAEGISSSPDFNFILQIFQGIAAGVILYVVFFEIFPKAKLIGGTGKQHIFAMVVGFLIFLPSIYFHNAVEHSDEDKITANNCSLNEN